jgi:hypothetical protein
MVIFIPDKNSLNEYELQEFKKIMNRSTKTFDNNWISYRREKPLNFDD